MLLLPGYCLESILCTLVVFSHSSWEQGWVLDNRSEASYITNTAVVYEKYNYSLLSVSKLQSSQYKYSNIDIQRTTCPQQMCTVFHKVLIG